jgi:hypothetical protein
MVANLCLDSSQLARLQEGARRSGERYTLEAMVANFRDGICQCLASREPLR